MMRSYQTDKYKIRLICVRFILLRGFLVAVLTPWLYTQVAEMQSESSLQRGRCDM